MEVDVLSLELQQTAFEGIRMCRDLRIRVDGAGDDNECCAEAMRRVFGVLEASLIRLLAENGSLESNQPAADQPSGDSSSSPKKKVSGCLSTTENS